MSEKDVKDNLVSIIDSMDRIRNETAANLGASDEAKMDYLRLAGELAGCAKVLIKENKLEDYVSNLSNLMAKNSSLRNYDTNQNDFWADAEPRLKIALEDCGSVLLGDAFNNESQIYHVFQALKCLTMQDKESKEEVYETILPCNSVLKENLSASSDALMHIIGAVADDGMGVKINNIDVPGFVKSFKQIGAFYADIPQEFYGKMKKEFPKTILIEGNGKKYARVVFKNNNAQEPVDVFKIFQQYAQLDFGDAEDSLVKGMPNFQKFGKKFVENIKSRIRFINPKKQKVLEKLLTLDGFSADNGSYKTQEQWIEYWGNIADGRRFASAADYYNIFKQLKDADNKTVIDSLRKDFNERWIVTGTRIKYQPDSLNAKIIHNYGSKDESLITETELEIPEYLGVGINGKINDELAKNYLKSLFSTDDDMGEIVSVLEYISDKPKEKIKLWTPPLESNQYTTRKKASERAVFFSSDVGGFHVSGDYHVDDISGRSRGVFSQNFP